MNINDTITDGTAKFVVRSIGFLDLLDALHPIGDIYLTVKEGTPFAKFGFGQWKLVGQNKCLWGGGTNSVAGTEIEAGLPNVTGTIDVRVDEGGVIPYTSAGAFANKYVSKTYSAMQTASMLLSGAQISFDASRSNPIYGKSTTVQPPAYVVYIWQRIA